ncbi:class I SAM-dependent methyltransferase [Shimia biformata]|uniref:class I SAM-dependent methyltransferase n=1 Tax=Shimia biformata TaxID=1294299 RepID=UPI00194F3C7B|nr:class I SAM-dependent methyltransferase [Shimia biformata]
MTHARLPLALDGAGLVLPEGRIAVFGPNALTDLSVLPCDRVQVVTGFKPDYDALQAQGYDCVTEATGDFDAALVFLPRAKALAQARIEIAARLARLVIVDGQKTDGVDSIWKACRQRADILGGMSKGHGRLFWFQNGDFADWAAPESQTIDGGFLTRPGVFSADGIDPASRLLAASLPEKLGKHVADLGAGWGYLSSAVLTRPGVETLHLVEADHDALSCARTNIGDPRASFHWADGTAWTAPQLLDAVVMNPPFHTSRAAEPALGRAFIANAARNLAPSGKLWMVSNRHLPYEAELEARFGKVEEIGGDSRFKLHLAQRPTRTRR